MGKARKSVPGRNNATRKGFTLIEILLVVALVAILFTVMAKRTTNMFRVNVQSSVRRFGAMVRYAYDDAILTGRIHRIVLNMDERTWGVEAAQLGELPIDKQKRELNPYAKKYDDAKKDDKDKDKSKDGDGTGDDMSFSKVGSGVLSAIPNGVAIVEVRSWRNGNRPANKGVVSIYAYPNGFIDEATVVLAEAGKENAKNYEISIESLTGKVKMETEGGK